MSHLDIYSRLMLPLWEYCAQYLIMCGIELVLLLLLLIFYNILLSYCLILIPIITAPGIPVRRNRVYADKYHYTEKTWPYTTGKIISLYPTGDLCSSALR